MVQFDKNYIDMAWWASVAHLVVTALCLVPNVARVSGLSILYCPFDLL